jgi:5-oxoprolinase (ATP-hydrolysing)
MNAVIFIGFSAFILKKAKDFLYEISYYVAKRCVAIHRSGKIHIETKEYIEVAHVGWQFWVDRGGTFTDIVARRPDGTFQVHKLLSEHPAYRHPVLQGIRDILGLSAAAIIPPAQISAIKMGTTVATNALLERKGARTVLVITQGFRDALRIGDQNRPDIFALQIVLPDLLYERVIEAQERHNTHGEVLEPLNAATLRQDLQTIYDEGIRSCAIAFMHGYRYQKHEKMAAMIAREVGFTQVSVSHEVSPLVKLISRGDTTVADAYLSPILHRYLDDLTQTLDQTRLLVMQSNGGLMEARHIKGKDALLSGPAGGVVGAVKTCAAAGIGDLIGFDMGGTSTDVCHYSGDYERVFETEISGVRLRTPMMAIHTVAAGGGSILEFDGAKFRVGPESAGSNPGPACYRFNGPLTVTDANVMVGKIQPQFFPTVFGASRDQPIDVEIVEKEFARLAQTIAQETGQAQTPEQVAQGFLTIAVENMANAIKKVSLQRGYDVAHYTLCCFGSAGGQHACAIAEVLGMSQILIHPFAGVLSAYGIGLADLRVSRQQTVNTELSAQGIAQLLPILVQLTATVTAELTQQSVDGTDCIVVQTAYLRYEGTNATIGVNWDTAAQMQSAFVTRHQTLYGFTVPEHQSLIIESIGIEAISDAAALEEPILTRTTPYPPQPITQRSIYTRHQAHHQWQIAPVFERSALQVGDRIVGPALIVEPTGTNMVEPNWDATLTPHGHLLVRRMLQTPPTPEPAILSSSLPTQPDPVMLEIFSNLFKAIAEQMGVTLQNTSASVNIKERLDFSCALFDGTGQLVANAPHIPVHLGSMGDSVQAILTTFGNAMQPGDAYVLNDPYQGGTHLPDITVVTPVFLATEQMPQFYVASRGHHADIGGITPGSMPSESTDIAQEGILIEPRILTKQGKLQRKAMLHLLRTQPYPARNPEQNLADLQAQLGANQTGVSALERTVEQYGLQTVQHYMQQVQNYAEFCVRRVIDRLDNGQFTYPMDDGAKIQVQITINRQRRSAQIDFTGTSPQQPNNFNAPNAVTKATVLYVFRTLVSDLIPLNAGCLRPLEIIIPQGCLLDPQYPAAVVAGNVETSQAIANALYGALGVMAASQGTMNNLTFGTDRYQYYETICGGSGAGPQFHGTDAVQTHMTNSRLTDPEILEERFPVLLKEFSIRPHSGGQGQHQGGNGVLRTLQFLEPMNVSILSSHRVIPPFGLAGGGSGQLGENRLQTFPNTQTQCLSGKTSLKVKAGDCLSIATPGGGGFGKTVH